MASVKIVELTQDNTCKLCENALGKYCCPKCNIIYCSLTCYQSDKHLQCSESFYKDCVYEQIDGQDENSKKKILEVLQRFHEQNKLEESVSDFEQGDDDDEYETEEDSDDDDFSAGEFESIFERMAGIDLSDTEEVWSRLNDDERQDFEAFVLSGDASKLIPMWEPWWSYRCDLKIVEISELDSHKLKCPKIFEPIRPFSELCSTEPAPCIPYNMANVAVAYAFTVRYFNGDYQEFAREASAFIYILSLNLKKNENFNGFEDAYQSVVAECRNSELGLTTDDENFSYTMSDMYRLLEGPHSSEPKFYLLAALSDLHALFLSASKSKKDTPKGEFFEKFTESQAAVRVSPEELKRALKKIEYLLSYVNCCYKC